MPLATLTAAEFRMVRQIVYDHSGIWMGDNKLPFLQVRLGERLRARSVNSVAEYCQLLPEAGETQRLIEAVAINETWFCREPAPIHAWMTMVLPRLLAEPGKVRVWSAGCSTGEEPYTLAMCVLDVEEATVARRVDIVASDLSHAALQRAEQGVYDAYSLRHAQPRWLDAYFQPAGNDHRVITERVRRMVRFTENNVIAGKRSAHIRYMDLIICRNVLIYFDERSRRQALANLADALKPGGYLILGQAESLLPESAFDTERLCSATLYRKPAP